MSFMYRAFYLTGAPASGKTTFAKKLQERVSQLKIVDYGGLLLESKKRTSTITYEDMRSESSKVISAADVYNTDQYLIDNLPKWLERNHVIIDSHAVTHEEYGQRVTAFSEKQLGQLNISAIIVLKCPPDELISRVARDPGGRLFTSPEQAADIQDIQISLSLVYAVILGCPLYVINNTRSTDAIVDGLITTLKL